MAGKVTTLAAISTLLAILTNQRAKELDYMNYSAIYDSVSTRTTLLGPTCQCSTVHFLV